MRTLPHSSECGEFFCPQAILPQPATTAQKDCASARENPTTFRENSSSFPKNLWTFRHNSSTPHSTRSPFAPFPTATTRQSPLFGRKIREKSPNCVSISTNHGFSLSKTVYFLRHNPISSDCSAHTSLPKDCHLCQIATFLPQCDRKATGNVGLLTNILYLCFLKCADLSSFFRPICRKPRYDPPRNDRLQTHYLHARTRAKELCFPFPLRKIGFTLCQ